MHYQLVLQFRAQLSPWAALGTNPMDLAGFLLALRSLIHGQGREENAIFLWRESWSSPGS